NPFQFVGQLGVQDESNGLEFMRARFYDAMKGRFLSQDPLKLGGGQVLLSAYAANNPIALIDPTGFQFGPSDVLGTLLSQEYWDKADALARSVAQRVTNWTISTLAGREGMLND